MFGMTGVPLVANQTLLGTRARNTSCPHCVGLLFVGRRYTQSPSTIDPTHSKRPPGGSAVVGDKAREGPSWMMVCPFQM